MSTPAQPRTRDVMSDLVRHLKIDHRQTNEDLRAIFGAAHASYISQKLAEGRWSVDDIDIIAKHYGLTACQVVSGYQSIRKDPTSGHHTHPDQ